MCCHVIGDWMCCRVCLGTKHLSSLVLHTAMKRPAPEPHLVEPSSKSPPGFFSFSDEVCKWVKTGGEPPKELKLSKADRAWLRNAQQRAKKQAAEAEKASCKVARPLQPLQNVAAVADFAKMEADTRAQDASDQEAFDEDMQENDIESVFMHPLMQEDTQEYEANDYESGQQLEKEEIKTNEKKRLVDKVGFLTKNKKHVSDELEATEQDDYDFTRVEFYDDEGWYSISKKEFDEWVQDMDQKPNQGVC